MTDLIVPTRRGFIAGLVSLVAAPAVIRVAKLMPIAAPKPLVISYDIVFTPVSRTGFPASEWRTLNDITREAVRLFKDKNRLLQYMEQNRLFAEERLLFDAKNNAGVV